MWKDWKKKVSDFFYEDVTEDDDEMEVDEAINDTTHRFVNNNRSVNTKMTYQYPKDQTTPFRFPVIPDYRADKKVPKTKRKHNIRPNHSRSHREKDVRIHGYTRHKANKELEDVPAYIRRRRAAESKKEQQKVEKKPFTNRSGKQERIELPHTKPDELDRVFKKRDGLLQEKEHVNKEEITKEKNKTKEPVQVVNKQDNMHVPITKSKINTRSNMESNTDLYINDLDSERYYNDPKKVISATVELDHLVEQDEEVISTIEEPIDVPNYLLNDPVEPDEDDSIWLLEQQSLLEETLTHFNIKAKIVNVTQGPAVTRFEIQPALGVKVSRIRNLVDDIKLNMAAKDIRIEAPIPGKNTIGIEVPNQYPQVVSLQEIIETEAFENASSPLTIALGLTIEGKPLITDIGKMPHGLIAGATITLNKPTIIIRPESLIHPLKELSNKANVTVETVDQALEVLGYIYE